MIEFVKEFPKTFEGEAIVLVNDRDEKMAFVQILDDPDNFRMIVDDFIINCNHPFIRRKFKDTYTSQWHGRLASDCPTFQNYVQLLHDKKIHYMKWAQKICRDNFLSEEEGLPYSSFRVNDIVKIPSEGGAEYELKEERSKNVWFGSRVDGGATGTFTDDEFILVRREGERGGRRLRETVPLGGSSGQQVALYSKPGDEDFDNRDSYFQDLGDFLGLHINDLDDAQYKLIQDSLQSFYKLPKVGEVIILYKVVRDIGGGHIVIDYEFGRRGKINIICIGLDDGKTRSIPLGELSLTAAGVWMRERQGWRDNFAWLLSYLRMPSWYAVNAISLWKQEALMLMLQHRLPVRWMTMRGRVNAALITLITLIPSRFDSVWNWLASFGYWQGEYQEVSPADNTMILGTRTYINAISGTVTNMQESNSLIKRLMALPGNAADGVNNMLDAGKQKFGEIVETTTEIVTKVFYGAIVLGSVVIVLKLVK
jgi:hypothetical protein